MSKRSVPTAALTLLVLGACTPKPSEPAMPAVDTEGIRAAITAEITKIGAAFVAKDTAVLKMAFTEDGVWILPDGSTFKGRVEIAKAAAAFLGTIDSVAVVSNTVDAILVANDHEAASFSTWTLRMKEKGKKAATHENPFADVWRKDSDGVWRIVREINAERVLPDSPKP